MVSEPKVFVTGGTGFIGSYILRTLVQANFGHITATYRASSKFDLVADIKEQVSWIPCNILDTLKLYESIRDQDVVIHAAALVSFDAKDRLNLTRTNVQGTANVVNASLEGGVKQLVHISSIGVFPRKIIGEVIDESIEWSTNHLTTDYALSKYQAELEVWRGSAEGLPVLILNPSLVIGSGFWAQGSAAIFSQVSKGLHFFPKGTTGIVDVRDVAKAVLLGMQKKIIGERIIISGENYSYQKMLRTIALQLNKRPAKIQLNRLLIEIALLRNWILTTSGISSRVLTRASLKNAQHSWTFDHGKSLRLLSLQYRKIDQCISETCAQLSEASEDLLGAKYLAL